ncbi:MAG TPA: SRPBCC family protein [Phycisphaerales bacterium]|nr:SRPBCC family protein [Phycisphaerales bacterium]HMP37609.1 SRPBCC family protein [Phycisphaerales bacterium]
MEKPFTAPGIAAASTGRAQPGVPAEIEIDPDIRIAWTLPARFYSDPATFDRCRERIFVRSWQLIGDTDSVKVPGQVQPVTLLEGLLGEPLLLTRDQHDTVRCLSNVCTHRGNLLCTAPGFEKHLTCRYHGRRFHLDGALSHMPEFEQARGFPAASDDLPAVPFGAWGKFIFASLAPPCPLEELLAPLKERVGWLPLHEFTFDPTRSRDYLVHANWALYCDNYLEGFHIPFVHAGLNEVIDYGSYATELQRWSNLQLGLARGGEQAFDLPPGSPDAGRRVAAYYYWLYPNTMVNLYPWGASINIVQPLAVDRTKVAFRSYVWKPELLERGAGALSALDRVEREDEAIVESVQQGVRSRLYERGRYSPTREQGVHHFHRLLAEALAG